MNAPSSVAGASSRRLLQGLLVLSGMSALAYQIVWTRELRLVFGHSTAASAAVLAIFIGGLGFGSLLLGPRADRHPSPLAFYAKLEGWISLLAALSTLLLPVVAGIYVGLGGSERLGPFLANLLRLLLTALVLGVPALLMGGTLPAAARVVQDDADGRRRGTALLYGLNTLGASAGAFLTTFLALEALGNSRTLLLASGLNLAVAAAAALAARAWPPASSDDPAVSTAPPEEGRPSAPRVFVLCAAAGVGFAFFLMELVWYRMLAPLLGGTIYTFGLILAVALAGIALGGMTYAALGRGRRFTLSALAVSCLVEAVAIAAPFALGDRLAVFALLLRSFGQSGFLGLVLGWATIVVVVVLPAAIVAGVQFPLLIGLLGRGRSGVGGHIGLVTACNTCGAILGALAGGFGLMPLLTGPGCWQLAAGLLGLLGLASALLAGDLWRRLPLPAALGILAGALLAAEGPTAAFRHSGIGAGRSDLPPGSNPVAIEDWLRESRRNLVYEAEGVESSLAIQGREGLAFALNGKVDGHSRFDAPTQVMLGLLGALLHPNPARILVVGLGTGSTAGWLADVPEAERVDVVELEPAVVEMARRCTSVNRNALENPRVRLTFGDARETLLTSEESYDLIVSEPSNPYRAGIASLFSHEFYRAVAARLSEGGFFLQWIQAYEIDAASLKSLYRTLSTEFAYVETWQSGTDDLVLLATRERLEHDVTRLAARIEEEPFRSALRLAWRTDSVEGVFARFVATPALASRLAAEAPALNTDDVNSLEFGFARTLGSRGLLDLRMVRAAASATGAELPHTSGRGIDLVRLEDEIFGIWSGAGAGPPPPRLPTQALGLRGKAHDLWSLRQRPAALEAWRGQKQAPRGPNELALVAEVTADAGDGEAEALIAALREQQPAEADACLARLRLRQGRHEEALTALGLAFERYRSDPWPAPLVMQGALDVALELAGQRIDLAPRVLEALREPFALRMLDDVRLEEVFLIGSVADPGPDCARLFAPLEPHVPFTAEWLGYRARCYQATGHPLLRVAEADLRLLESYTPEPLLAKP